MGRGESKLSFLRTSQHFYRSLAILEHQVSVVSEQFEAENISLLSGRLVLKLHPKDLQVFADLVKLYPVSSVVHNF